jgi:hypothetical protein
LEKKFFAIARKFTFGAAALMLFLAIGLGAYAILGLKFNVKEDIAIPTVNSADFFKELSEANATTHQSRLNTNHNVEVTQKSKIDEEAEKAAKIVAKNLNDYIAKKASFDASSYIYYNESKLAEIFKNDFAKNILELSDEKTTIDFLVKIAKASEELNAKYEQFNSRLIEPTDFLEWYRKKYISKLQEEKTRIEAEKAKAEESKAQSLTFAYFAAVAFIVFVSFTIILVLFRIELNTRKEEVEVKQKGLQ